MDQYIQASRFILQNTTKHTKIEQNTQKTVEVFTVNIYRYVSVLKTYIIMFRLIFVGICIMFIGLFNTNQ